MGAEAGGVVCASGSGGPVGWWVIPSLFAKVVASDPQPSLHS